MTFKQGDLVWTQGPFVDLYHPYRVVGEGNTVGGSEFYDIVPAVLTFKQQRQTERMNSQYLSKKHPLGWRITLPDGNELT